MKIKYITHNDLDLASGFVWSVFSEFVMPGYSQEGIETFQKFIHPEELQKLMEIKKIFMLGCFDGEKLVGVLAIMDFCHVSLFFVDKTYQRRGIAKALFTKALKICSHKNPELNEITANSSLYAVPVYQRLGFEIKGKPTTNDGITFIPMRMPVAKHEIQL